MGKSVVYINQMTQAHSLGLCEKPGVLSSIPVDNPLLGGEVRLQKPEGQLPEKRDHVQSNGKNLLQKLFSDFIYVSQHVSALSHTK